MVPLDVVVGIEDAADLGQIATLIELGLDDEGRAVATVPMGGDRHLTCLVDSGDMRDWLRGAFWTVRGLPDLGPLRVGRVPDSLALEAAIAGLAKQAKAKER